MKKNSYDQANNCEFPAICFGSSMDFHHCFHLPCIQTSKKLMQFLIAGAKIVEHKVCLLKSLQDFSLRLYLLHFQQLQQQFLLVILPIDQLRVFQVSKKELVL
jgi:hypothetical protein